MAKITLDRERCKGCGLCVSVCPRNVIAIGKNARNKKGYYTAECIDDEKCVGCAMCAVMCPDCVITVER